jgi:ankyrin repeat protein
MAATYENHPEIVDLLIKRGADVKARNASNDTALDIAKRKEHQDIVKILMEHEAKK